MRKVLITLATLLATILSSGLPVYAQTPPHVFVGQATLDGAPAPDGTVVLGLLNGRPLAKARTTVQDGRYTLFVEEPGESTIDFAIGGFIAEQSTGWEAGGATALNLTASSQLPSIQIAVEPAALRIVSAGDSFKLKVKANTGFSKASGGEISLSYSPEVFQVKRDGGSLHQGLSRQLSATPGLYQSSWDYAAPISTDALSGELESIYFSVLESAPAGPTTLTLWVSVFGPNGREFPLEPNVLNYQVNIAGLPGDLNGDKAVDIFDLAALGAVWGLSIQEAGLESKFDIDRDGLVGVGDLVSLLQNYRVQNYGSHTYGAQSFTTRD